MTAAATPVYLDAGQPHFNREFVQLVGISPERWKAEREASVRT